MAGSSLDQNPPNATRNITAGGSDWLWAVFAIMALAALGMIAHSFTVSSPQRNSPVPAADTYFLSQRPRGTRFFHNIASIILTTSTIAYFAMASDLGATPVTEEFSRGVPGSTRQIWVSNFACMHTRF